MKLFTLLTAYLVFAFWTTTCQAEEPNVVIIYGDDVGWGDVGVYGSQLIPTPNIDRLAKQGLLFTDGHCTASTCTPSRFSMLTGIHGFRHGVRVLPPNAPMTIRPEMTTLPEIFQRAGYETAVIGKWHLGLGDGKTPVDWNGQVKPGPLEVGFDYSFLLPYTNDRVPCVYLENHLVVGLDPADPLHVGKLPEGVTATTYPDGKKDRSAMTYYPSSHGHNQSVINGIGRIGYQWGGQSALWDDETMADVFVEKSVDFIRRQKKDKPFFLFFSSQDIHVPRTPHPRFQGKTELGFRGDAMVQLDWATGQIMDALKQYGFAENTLVVFSSDNGPVYDDGYEDGTKVRTSSAEVDNGHDGSGPYRGGKYQIYEGGTRVPFIIRWPEKIQPGKSDALVSQIDFLASFAALVGVELKSQEGIDSRNFLPAFLGKDPQGADFILEESGRALAVREGDWKFIEPARRNQRRKTKKNRQKKTKAKAEQVSPKSQLYDLGEDQSEQNDVANSHPERTSELKGLLQRIKQPQGIRQMKRP